ncbi:MAG: hypothetical protein DHS20C12_03380 [Pseudohongiella sp.]|nr:MAG: hypothetical protein DHS20C12_03380 [Pseudohongiella sp.]
MFGLGSSSEKRIILINFEGLAVYGLDNGRLMKLATFIDDDVGHDKFRTYIIDESLIQTSLVVDSPAEDFIVEKVVHVSAYDRKSFLNRKLDQHFRNVEFRSAKVLGRDSSGRRDDRVLFSAITQSRNIDNWIRVMLEEQVAIKSITSPAFAISKVARALGLETENQIFLVNWQRNGIRQSLISNNKLMFSRLTPLPLDPDADLAKAVLDATLQTQEYLERIGLVEPGENIDLHVVSPVLEADAFEELPGSADFGRVFHHNSIDLMPIDKYGGPQYEITAILLCLDWGVRNGDFGNIYASQGAMRFKKLRLQRNLIAVGCLLALFVGGVVSAPVLTDVIRSESSFRSISLDMQPIQQQYDELTAQFPATPIPSEAMELVVNNYDLIDSQNHYPVELLSEVSQIVAQHPSISLSSVVWKLEASEEFLSIHDAILANAASIEIELYGDQFGANGYENADTLLRAFIDSLSGLAGATVTPIRLPVESGPNSSVTAVVGGEQFDSEFALSVRIES